MTNKDRMLKRDWEGRYVRLLRTLENKGGTIFEAGEVMKVTRNFGGLNLEAIIRCKSCTRRARARITKINEGNVELLDKDWRPE